MAVAASFHASVAVAAKRELDARAELEPPSAKVDAKARAGASAVGFKLGG